MEKGCSWQHLAGHLPYRLTASPYQLGGSRGVKVKGRVTGERVQSYRLHPPGTQGALTAGRHTGEATLPASSGDLDCS